MSAIVWGGKGKLLQAAVASLVVKIEKVRTMKKPRDTLYLIFLFSSCFQFYGELASVSISCFSWASSLT